MKLKFEDVDYNGIKCLQCSNSYLKIMVPFNFGPRILFFGLEKDHFNVFGFSNASKKTKWGKWNIYGGHRFWLSPEIFPQTYYPDNKPVNIVKNTEGMILSQGVKDLGICKTIELKFLSRNKLKVNHILENMGSSPLTASLWALSLMRKGGLAIIPENTKKEDRFGLLPVQNLVTWPYTNLKASVFKQQKERITIKQGATVPFKIGQRVPSGWCAYEIKNHLFKKEFVFDKNLEYPDFQSNVEVYSCQDFLELETLSPIYTLSKGSKAQYSEIWSIKLKKTNKN